MKQAIVMGALVALMGCGGASGQGSSAHEPGHAHGEHKCEHCKQKGGEHKCEHCKQKGGDHKCEHCKQMAGDHKCEHCAQKGGDQKCEHCQQKGGDMHGGGHGGMHHGGGHHDGAHHGGHEGHGGPLVHRFEKADDWAKEFDNPERNAWQKPDEVVKAMSISAGMTVADIGAGTGYFLPYLSRAVGPTGKVLGLDIEADMVRYMTERATKEKLANVTAQQVTGADPGVAAGSVDRILIVDTWHHIPERQAYAQKLRAALRPGGLVIIVDFTLEATKGPPKEHRLSADKVIAELDAGGLTAKAIDESLPEQYIVVAKPR